MKKRLEINIEFCTDCPFSEYNSGFCAGDKWLCNNDDVSHFTIAYADDVEDAEKVPIPEWCPLPDIE